MAEAVTSKQERINLRLDAGAKQRLEKAASIEGRTVSGFILTSALASADQAIRDHATMTLSERDAEAFFDAILNPPQPGNKLVAAIKEYRERVVSR
ncbi:MAG: DUF1778 domain-containing protein [Rhodospirillales bacterium]|nr:DUF1778 domain-containing protein [Rhodospirillales bacterium]